jgi:hypothetical protein
MALRVSSPRTRGCFPIIVERIPCDEVFPAHAGVFLVEGMEKYNSMCLPRARGGVSKSINYFFIRNMSSPRTRGCFYLKILRRNNERVFPAHAGVFLLFP